MEDINHVHCCYSMLNQKEITQRQQDSEIERVLVNVHYDHVTHLNIKMKNSD